MTVVVAAYDVIVSVRTEKANLKAAMKILSKSGIEFQRLELPKVTNHYPCNPSIIISGNRILASYRGCNYSHTKPHGFISGSWASEVPDSQNYITQITDEF